MRVRAFLHLAMVAGCVSERPVSPDAGSLPYVEPAPMQISGPTTSWFEPEALPSDSSARSCGGFADLDGDGRSEVVVVGSNGFRVSVRAHDGSWTHQDHLYKPDAGNSEDRIACDVGDADSDGDLDLVMAGGGSGWVALNEGNTFRFVALPLYTPGFDVTDHEAPSGSGVSFLWRGEGGPDLFVLRKGGGTGGVNEPDPFPCICGYKGMHGTIRCGHDTKPGLGLGGVYLRNQGGGVFHVDDSAAPDNGQYGYGLGVYDADGDGRQDLWIANDFGYNELFLDRGSSYENVSADWNVSHYNHGMSVVVGDIDRDGAMDLGISEIGIPLVQFGLRGGGFEDPVAQQAGFGQLALWSWGTELEDFDNDGLLDLLVVNQHVSEDDIGSLCVGQDTPPVDRQSEVLLFRNVGARTFRAENPFATPENPLFTVPGDDYAGGRAVASGDVNGDGVLDLLFLRYTRLENESRDKQAWVLYGRTSSGNRGIRVRAPQGSVVTVCVGSDCQRREIGGAHGVAALYERAVHFGVGRAVSAEVTVVTPGGSTCVQTVLAGTVFPCRP